MSNWRQGCRVVLVVVAGGLAACAVGPHYEAPAAPAVGRYTTVPALDERFSATGVTLQTLDAQAPVHADWWKAFASDKLDRLVSAALARNPTIGAAQATLEQARFEVKAAQGAFFPHVTAGLSAERNHPSGAATGGNFGSQTYNVYTGQLAVGYNPDVFGINRLVTRAAEAQVDVAASQLAAARLAIAGNVVSTTVALAALNAELQATHKSLAEQGKILKLAQARHTLGATDEGPVLTQQSLLASTQAGLARIAQARDQALHLLATLTGAFPAQLESTHIPALDEMTLPVTLPLSLPSALVRQRPDIRAAEAQLRGANARVGEAVARMYPTLQLTASFGTQSNLARTFFDPASRIWDLAAGLAAPLFEGGTLRARKHAAKAAYRAVFANYQGAVLGAFRDVADVLRALQHDAEFLQAQTTARDASQRALTLAAARYQAGDVDLLPVLTNEIQYQNARIAWVQAMAQRYADSAGLYVALGGGAWPTPPVAHAASAAAPVD